MANFIIFLDAVRIFEKGSPQAQHLHRQKAIADYFAKKNGRSASNVIMRQATIGCQSRFTLFLRKNKGVSFSKKVRNSREKSLYKGTFLWK